MYVKVTTRLINKRWTNVARCLLTETKALCKSEFMKREGQKVGRVCTCLFFSCSLPHLPELQETELPWALVTLSLGCVYFMVNLLYLALLFCCTIVTHPVPFPLFFFFFQENTMNKYLLGEKKNKKRYTIINICISNRRGPKYIKQKLAEFGRERLKIQL